MEFYFFGPIISCCLKTGNILVIEQKYTLQKAGFSPFLNHGNVNWSSKSHGKVINFIAFVVPDYGPKQ